MERQIKITIDGVRFIVFYIASSDNVLIDHVSIETDEDGNNLMSYLSYYTLSDIHDICLEHEEAALTETLESLGI